MILTCFRAFGVQMLADEGPGWFPEPELKEFYDWEIIKTRSWRKRSLVTRKTARKASSYPVYHLMSKQMQRPKTKRMKKRVVLISLRRQLIIKKYKLLILRTILTT